MPRKATGTVYRYGDHWVMKITLADGTRGAPHHFDPSVSEAQARAVALKASERERVLAAQAEKKVPLQTVDAWAERWFAERRAAGQTGVRQDESRWRKWIAPYLISMEAATPDDCEAIVRVLDAAVRNGDIMPKTAKLTWGVVTSAFDEARKSKVPELRVRARDDNPLKDVRGPDAGAERVAAWLYPNEAAKLLACQRVPIRWRRLIALQGYAYLRPGELEALRCDAVDLAGDVFRIHQAADYSKERGSVKSTKTKAVRSVPIEPTLRPLVEVLLHEAEAEGRELLVTMPPVSDLAAGLRMYLRRAGVTRAELYANDAARRPIRYRDLRATGITWRALRGDSHLDIQRDAGHESFETTQLYIRAAGAVGRGVGAPFPPLPPELLESSRIVTVDQKGLENKASPAGFEPHQMRTGCREHDDDMLVSTPFGLIRDGQATAVADAVTIPVTIPPADLQQEARATVNRAMDYFCAGKREEAIEGALDFLRVVRFGGKRCRGAPRYITHDLGDGRGPRTQTVSGWARELGRTSQGLGARLDTMPVVRALTPAKGRAA